MERPGISRRRALKGIGAAGVVSVLGLGSISGSAFGASSHISATNPSAVSNDRGDLTRVTVDPTFRIEWEGLDTAVGKVFYAIEARTRDDGNWRDWSPVFRSTPWLTPGTIQGVNHSKPGTTGFYEIADPLSAIMNRSSADRGAKDEDPRSLPRAIEVVNEFGRPDYENADFSSHPASASTYLAGNSMGSADAATEQLDNWEISGPEGVEPDVGSSSLSGPNGDLPLVNNFPGAESGYYGAAQGTEHFDVDEDGRSDTDTVQIRYTFALQTINQSMLGSVNDDIGEGWLEYVRQDDVQEDNGNSVLVMNGEDGYPDITQHGASSPASVHYDAYQAVAGNHPSVVSTTSQFTVSVTNEASSSTVTSGNSSTGAEGTGQ